MRALGNTRKVVLSALYAEVLRRGDHPPAHIDVLVKATEARSVKRLDMVKVIVELRQVCRVPSPPSSIYHLLRPRQEVGGDTMMTNHPLAPRRPSTRGWCCARRHFPRFGWIWDELCCPRGSPPSLVGLAALAVGSLPRISGAHFVPSISPSHSYDSGATNSQRPANLRCWSISCTSSPLQTSYTCGT